MFKKFTEFLKKVLYKQNKKKLIENSVIVIIIGVIVIIAGGSLVGGKDDKGVEDRMQDKQALEPVAKMDDAGGSDEIEKKLEDILSQINGAGKVSVMITYVYRREIVPAYDTRTSENVTKERDNEGGTRDIRQEEQESSIAYSQEHDGTREPVVIKEVEPVVKGVVVVCEGAGQPAVKENITKAVQALTDVPIHKIQVFEKEK